ncbi:AfsR/SARP family transcriptional regulator [Planosporangium sp. 12N6]|uniref:AfsR/SARP family transcriptional regulator n=1 Tax=Planosporangium spinosum TaxID=3402278 RepID=UPI003CE787ED
MEFRILGPIEVRVPGRVLYLGGLRQRRILAALLLHPDREVSVDRLIDVVWGEDPPATARRQAQNRVATLRSTLSRFGGVIDTGPSGYRLRLGPHELDATLFDDLVDRGRARADPTLLRQALDLWRGPALAGLGGAVLEREAARLEEHRLAVLEECLGLELAAGQHDRVAAELGPLVAEHPLRERLVGQLMVALYRCGRQAEAIDAYRGLAARLADELGIDPGPELRRVYEALLRDEPVPAFPVPPRADAPRPGADRYAPRTGADRGVVPAQLPPDVAAFTGRSAALARLDGLLSDSRAGRAVVISAIAGTAGVGKTALAVHWAHRVRDKFPDGQLYVNLRGHAPTPPLRPIDALAGFLRALGVPAEAVPTDPDEAAALYRSVLADRRVLVLLDNAAGAEQVRPLLPGNAECLALITSRTDLAGLVAFDGGHRLRLDVLAADEALALLALLLGRDRVAAEPDASAELARLCAYLPLALRIAAANLPDAESLAAYAARLSAGNRLAALEVEGDRQAAVRAAFDLSYAALPEPARRMFRLLGLVPGPDVTAEAAGALTGLPADEATRLLDRLAAVHLVDRHAPGRYGFHDLLRLHAAAHADADPERVAAVERLYDHYVRTARAAGDRIFPRPLHLPLPERTAGGGAVPVFPDTAPARDWLEAERVNLVTAATHAAEHGPAPAAWLLVDAVRVYFISRMYAVDLAAMARSGLRAAEAAGAREPQVIAHLALGVLSLQQSRYPQGIDHLTRMLELARATGWDEAQAGALGYLGSVYRRVGQPRKSVDYLSEALTFDQRAGNPNGQAQRLLSLGHAYHELGMLDRALDCHAETLTVFERLGSTASVSNAYNNLGHVYRELGDLRKSREYHERALEMMREVGDRLDESDVLRLLAGVHRIVGDHDAAVSAAEQGLALAREIGSGLYEAFALIALAAVDDDLGRHRAAVDHCRQALSRAEAGNNRYPQVEAMIILASAHCHLGRHADALTWGERALRVATESEYRLLTGRARTVLAEIELARDAPERAAGQARRALAVSRECGHRLGEAPALVVLARALAGTDRAAAREYARQARSLYAAMGAAEPAALAPLRDD